MSSIAILWQRFGPYHLARLRSAGQWFERVDAIEVAAKDQYRWDSVATADAIRRHCLFPDSTYESLRSRAIAKATFAKLDDLRPDVVAVNGWAVAEAVAALKWARQNKKRAILMCESHKASSNRLKEFVKGVRIRRFHAAIVGGRWHAQYLIRHGFPPGKIFLGYDAVDNDHFREGAAAARSSAEKIRSQLKLPPLYFFCNCRFIARKKVDILIEAFAQYCRILPEGGSLVVSGSGECEAEWKALAERLDIADRVHWAGFVQYDDLPAYYGLARAFVHIASEEAWGLVVNEAVAVGLPLIVSKRVGSVCELASDRNGILVEPDDVDAVTEALVRLTTCTNAEIESMRCASQEYSRSYEIDRFGRGLALAAGMESA